jgi:type IV pilus assembly PilX-like protein
MGSEHRMYSFLTRTGLRAIRPSGSRWSRRCCLRACSPRLSRGGHSLGRTLGQDGIALITALLALSILTLIGMTMMFVSSSETLVNRNNKAKLVNLYAAESAIEEARDRIKVLLGSGLLSLADLDRVVYITSSQSINPTAGDSTSNAYFDDDYSPGLSITLVPTELNEVKFSWAKIIQKSEVRAGYDLDGSGQKEDVSIFFGYDRFQPARLSQYVNSGTNSTTHIGNPVYQVTTMAKDASGFRQIMRSDISMIPQPPLSAAVFCKDAISVGGGVVEVQGRDEDPLALKDLNGLESNALISGSMATIQGSPLPARSNSTLAYSIESIIKSLRPPLSHDIEKVAPSISKLPDGSYVGTGLSLGQIPTAGDVSQPVFANGPLSLSDSSGQGLLVVNGDLTISGSFVYYGLIVVKGKVDLNGTGSPGIEIHGAILAGSALGDQTTLLSGNVRIVNNSTILQKQFGSLQYTRLASREILR